MCGVRILEYAALVKGNTVVFNAVIRGGVFGSEQSLISSSTVVTVDGKIGFSCGAYSIIKNCNAHSFSESGFKAGVQSLIQECSAQQCGNGFEFKNP